MTHPKPLSRRRAKPVPETKLAFEVNIHDMICVVFAATPAKARWVAVKSYWEAGYGRGRGTWPYAKEKRIPRLDKSPLRLQPAKAWTPEYAEDMR